MSKTVNISFGDIIDAIMAADGMAASLNGSDGVLKVINDDHELPLKYLVAQAVAIVAAEAGEVVTGYDIADSAGEAAAVDSAEVVSIKLAEGVNAQPAAQQLLTAVAWRTLHLAYVGCDKSRADSCAATSAAALAQLRVGTLVCKAHRESAYY